MVNCEVSYLDSNSKVQFNDYLFAVPSSGDHSKFNTYTVKYDALLRIHRVFKSRLQGVDPESQLWNECERSRKSRQAVASSVISFPFLSWPFRAPVPNSPESRTRESEGLSSSSSEKSGTNTPITPFSPHPEGVFPVNNAQFPDTTAAVDLTAALVEPQGSSPSEKKEAVSAKKQNQSKEGPLKHPEIEKKRVTANVTFQARSRYFGVHACQAIEKGLPGSSPLRTCSSISDTTEEVQQTVASAVLPGKMLPRKPAHPFDRVIRDGNAECKAYQAKQHTQGYLSQYLRAGTEAEINEIWLASPLSSKTHPSFEEADDLALALWRWHQMCFKIRELRMSGCFVPPRLGGREGDIDERSAWSHPTNHMSEGIRTEIPQELGLDRIPFTAPYQKDTNNGQVGMPHHFNRYDEPVYCKSHTPPEVSLWAFHQPYKKFRKDSREGVLVSRAYKLIDPYFHHGPPENLHERGPKLREIVTGWVEKVYTLSGTWVYDRYDPDETVPITWEEVGKRYGWVNPHYQMPQNNGTVDPQANETVEKKNKDIYFPESNVYESRRWLEALDLARARPRPESEVLVMTVTKATARVLDASERFAAGSSGGNETPGEVVNAQSGPAPDASEQPTSDSSGDLAVDEVSDEHSEPATEASEQLASESSEENAAAVEIQDEHSRSDCQTTGSVSSEEDEVTGEVLDDQSGLERQTTASDAAGESQTQSYGDFLEESSTEEDLTESTPPSRGRSSVSPNAEHSPTPQRVLPFDNGPANDLARSLASRASEEEIQARLNRARLRSPSTDRPHVHNSEDEDSIDYTDTWPKRNQLPTTPNPQLANFADTSVEEEDDLDHSDLDEAISGQVPRQAPQGGFPFGPQNSAPLDRVQPRTTSSSGSPSTSRLSDLTPEESVDDMALTESAEVTAPAPEMRNRSTPAASGASDVESSHDEGSPNILNSDAYNFDVPGDLSDIPENDEAQSDPAWLEYTAERGAVESAADDDLHYLPAPIGQEVEEAVEDSPIEDGDDPSWLDYQEARGQMDAVFDERMREDEADEAAERWETRNENNMLIWLQERADMEANEQGDVQRQRQTRAATTAALAHYSDISEIPLPSTPTFSEYFFGSWALSLGAVVEKLPFVIPSP